MKELFGQRLREQRLKHHLTLEQVAEKADLSANYIGMVERGLKEPGLATIVKILNALNGKMSTLKNAPYIFLNRFWYSKITATS